jgi:hypothetical protein
LSHRSHIHPTTDKTRDYREIKNLPEKLRNLKCSIHSSHKIIPKYKHYNILSSLYYKHYLYSFKTPPTKISLLFENVFRISRQGQSSSASAGNRAPCSGCAGHVVKRFFPALQLPLAYDEKRLGDRGDALCRVKCLHDGDAEHRSTTR